MVMLLRIILLCLPSIRLLQSVSSNLDVYDGNNCITLLKMKADLLTPGELLANIQLDQIYVKPKHNTRAINSWIC